MTGLIVDLFAGGGGASAGIEAALGRPVDIAINHDRVALAVHKANHPRTRHLEADIWEVRPREATGGRPVDLLWASPDCTHFSVAKGGVPRCQNIRSLAWIVVRWARDVRPRVICLENVREFQGWGPLGADGRPDKARMGQTFNRWRAQLVRLGYQVDYRVLDASLYGAPTRRRRLFLVARCDGQPIRWPKPTHGPGLLPLHTAAECIDWSLPCPSIFDRKRPLAEKTLWRIAQGLRRFVLETPAPFIVQVAHGGAHARTEDAQQPLTTVTATQRAHAMVAPLLATIDQQGTGSTASTAPNSPLPTTTTKNRHAVVAPVLTRYHGGDERRATRPEGLETPLTTQDTANRFGLIAPTLVQTGYGERPGQAPRALDIEAPLGTIIAGGTGGNGKHAFCAAFLAKHFGERQGGFSGAVALAGPAATVTARDHHALVSAVMVEPGQRHGRGQRCADDPLSTVVAKDRHAVTAATLVKFNGNEANGHPGCAPVDAPLPTVMAQGNHVAEVRAFLLAYYGSDGTGGQQMLDPLRTVTARHRLGLVTVAGVDYQIVDIGMRMLEPHELLAAQFGRFAATYDISGARTKKGMVRLIGNSVCPEAAEALVRVNFAADDAQECVA